MSSTTTEPVPPARAPQVGAPSTTSGRFAHRPGLDGLRGVAVAAVLLFHSDFSWAVGGYLGVSTFFTLSGFLITTLLLREAAATERIDLLAFWIRRIRRLLPAALLGITLALAYVLVLGDSVAVDRARGDAISALLYVANWRLVLSEQSYADLFAEASPFQHLWSLAIEEQFYLLLPLLAALASRAATPARRLAVLSAVGIVASLLANIALRSNPDRLYYGTDTRASEILVGVLIACLEHEFGLSRRLARPLRTAGPIAFVAALALWTTVAQSSDWLHPWILLANASLTAIVILAVLEPGRFTSTLSARPAVSLGLVSYGVYVFHWPIFLWLNADRTGLDGPALLAVRLGVTFAVSVASYRLIETPIRRPPVHLALLPRREFRNAGLALVGVIVIAAILPTTVSRSPTIDFEGAAELQDELAAQAEADARTSPSDSTAAAPGAEPSADPADGVSDPAPLPTPPRVALFGDSTAMLFLPGLLEWSIQTNLVQMTTGAAFIGCSVTRGGARLFDGEVIELAPSCEFSTFWPPALETGQPDVAVVEIGIWDITDRLLPGEDVARAIGDPVYDRFLRSEIDAATDLLLGTAERVIWILQPPPVRS